MRAITQRTFGGPEVLELVELHPPVPGPDQVLVQIHAAGVNPADWKIRSGLVGKYGEPPLTPGLDFSGTTDDGQEVYGVAFPPNGSYAEFAAVDASTLAPKPRSLDHVHAAALPTAALTAWQSLVGNANIGPGDRVLIHAAAGGVGHLAVQIAKSRGAYVIGTARPAKHEFLRSLGVDELIDYTSADFTDSVRDVDVVLDPIAEDYGPRSLAVLRPGGVLLDIRGTGPDRTAVRARAAAGGFHYVAFGFRPTVADLTAIATLVDEGLLRGAVEQVLPLEHAAKAHELSETGRVAGKVVLSIR